MSVLGRYRQQPRENLKRIIDYKAWLESSEEIEGVTAEVTPVTDTPLVVDPILIDSGGKKFAYWTSGGEDGITYTIEFSVTTQTQTREDEVEIEVEEVNNNG